MNNKITVLLCPPGSKPKLIEIYNEVKVMEELLEGRLGIKVLEEDGICLVFNDEGHTKALDLNRVIQEDPIFGSCFFCRKEGERFTSLTEEEILDLEHLLA
ncbi:MAG: hypothetical protein APF84_06130 [Gracilibacter sp. BRH_c7a]|nr:MAG: hypothetical protein APF84_06130 [Gracilibacter sp. BRH_c7a]